MQPEKTLKKGFTLSELLVVLIVVVILGVVTAPIYSKALKRSRASDALKVLSLVSAKQEVYFINNNKYASTFSELSAPVKGLIGTGDVTLGNFTYKLQNSCIVASRPSDNYTIYKNFITQQESCFSDPDTNGCDALQGMIPETGVVDGCELVPK
jgi:prepilin-type N-terminal cleavage/methylation domain-containing protein